MIDYSRGKLYKIEPICEHPEGDIYIGSTTKKTLAERMANGVWCKFSSSQPKICCATKSFGAEAQHLLDQFNSCQTLGPAGSGVRFGNAQLRPVSISHE